MKTPGVILLVVLTASVTWMVTSNYRLDQSISVPDAMGRQEGLRERLQPARVPDATSESSTESGAPTGESPSSVVDEWKLLRTRLLRKLSEQDRSGTDAMINEIVRFTVSSDEIAKARARAQGVGEQNQDVRECLHFATSRALVGEGSAWALSKFRDDAYSAAQRVAAFAAAVEGPRGPSAPRNYEYKHFDVAYAKPMAKVACDALLEAFRSLPNATFDNYDEKTYFAQALMPFAVASIEDYPQMLDEWMHLIFDELNLSSVSYTMLDAFSSAADANTLAHRALQDRRPLMRRQGLKMIGVEGAAQSAQLLRDLWQNDDSELVRSSSFSLLVKAGIAGVGEMADVLTRSESLNDEAWVAMQGMLERGEHEWVHRIAFLGESKRPDLQTTYLNWVSQNASTRPVLTDSDVYSVLEEFDPYHPQGVRALLSVVDKFGLSEHFDELSTFAQRNHVPEVLRRDILRVAANSNPVK